MESQTAWSRGSAVFGVADISDALMNGENVLDLDVQNVSSIRRFNLYLFHNQEQIFNWKMKSCAQLNEKKEWTIFKKESSKLFFRTVIEAAFLGHPMTVRS
jgi:beta-galactosidase